MLKKLRIQQFVIIDQLELVFQPGLTIVTGETGAGKSILLDATGLVLGDAPDFGAIRQGADEAVIEATFAPLPNHSVWEFLREQNLCQQVQPDFLIYRSLRQGGGEDIRVNGKPVDLDLLKKLGTHLAEIHGQFANQSLLDPSNQLNLLDLSGAFPPEVFKNVADALREVRTLTKALEEENIFLNSHKRLMPKIEEVVGKFEKIGMRDGFVEHVQAEYARLRTAKETSEAFQAILSQLIAANGGVMSLSAAYETLTRNKNLDQEKLSVLVGQLSTSLENARAAVKEMRRIAPEYEIDTEPLYRYQDILGVMKRIAAEAKIEMSGVQAYWEEMAGKRTRFHAGRETIARMQDDLIKAKNKYRHHAHILHEHRVEAGRKLSEAITNELPPLKLLKAEFAVKVEEIANMEWTEKGLDKVTFTARMNPGQPFSPVSETASGGELARLILALKVVLQKVVTIPTLIFDEVDTGIGGAAAAAVGERLALLSDDTQVLVITHSPQVASRGEQHLHVSKKTDGVTTTSIVNALGMQERVDEISRMLAGDTITPEAAAAAKKLIEEATLASQARRRSAVSA